MMRVFPDSMLKAVLIFTLPLIALPAQAVAYTMVDLGTLGGSYSYAYGINNKNQIVGVSQTAGNAAAHATYWDSSGAHDLGTLGGSESIAYAINNNGVVVGVSLTTNDVNTHAVAWVNGKLVDIGGTNSTGVGYAINDANVGVGNNRIGSNSPMSTAWNSSGSMSLGTLPGGTFSYANGINSSNWVCGNSDATGQAAHATLWKGGAAIDLGTLGGTSSFAKAINAAGDVVGASYLTGNVSAHGTYWSAQGMIDLGTLPGGNYSIAYGLNNLGQAVGDSYSPTGSRHAILWNGTTPVDLNDYLSATLKSQGWIVDVAQNINDNGWIIGGVVNSVTGQEHAYALVPVSP